MRSIITSIKQDVFFEKEEYASIFLYTLLFAFIGLLFTLQRERTLEYAELLFFFIQYILLFLAIIFLVTLSQKIIGSLIGSYVKITRSWAGIIGSVFVSLFSSGFFFFFIPPRFSFTAIKHKMVGRFYRVLSHKDYATLSTISIFILLIFLLFILTTPLQTVFFFEQLGLIILLYIIYSLIPFDFLLSFFDKSGGVSLGLHILYKSRTWFVFCVVFVFAAYLLTIFNSVFLSILLASCMAAILAFYYFQTFE